MAANQTTVDLSVTGMSCSSCVRHVTEALEGVNGVDNARVDLEGGRATVAYDPASATLEGIVQAVADAGYQAAAIPSAT